MNLKGRDARFQFASKSLADSAQLLSIPERMLTNHLAMREIQVHLIGKKVYRSPVTEMAKINQGPSQEVCHMNTTPDRIRLHDRAPTRFRDLKHIFPLLISSSSEPRDPRLRLPSLSFILLVRHPELRSISKDLFTERPTEGKACNQVQEVSHDRK